MFFSHVLLWVTVKWHRNTQVSVSDLECLDLCLLVLFDTKPWGKMEAPRWGPSTCVALDHFKDGGGEEDAMRFTHTCLRAGQRWSIPPRPASACELLKSCVFLSQLRKKETQKNKLLRGAVVNHSL